MCVCMYGAVYHEKLRERVLVPGEHLRHFAGHLVRSRRSFEVIGDVAACKKCMYVCMYYVKKNRSDVTWSGLYMYVCSIQVTV